MRPVLSVVIPMLDEASNVEPLHGRLVQLLEGLDDVEDRFELIFVDDGSSDDSAELVRALHARDPRVKLISFSRNFGHQQAITAGMDHATGDAVVIMDADFQHPPELIETFVRHWREGHEIVYSVREHSDTGWLKRQSSRAFYRVFRFLSGIDLPQSVADFRLLDRKVVDAFAQIRERTRFLRGLTVWVGYRSRAVPYDAGPRRAGRTKYTARRMLSLAASGILSFSTVPLQLAIWVGFALAAFGFAYGVLAVWRWYNGDVVVGWTSTFVLFALVGGIQLVVLGVLGLYLGKVYEELKQRPIYLVRDAVGFQGDQPPPPSRNGPIARLSSLPRA